jgi:tRNA pseudouridine55 synthase
LGLDPSSGPHGALLVDKPSGPTSHDIVGFVRRLLKTKRVGHTGTLDPLATGLLIMLVGHATRLAQFLVADEKEYVAGVRLGIATPTYDSLSLADPRTEVRGSRPDVLVTLEQIQSRLPDFLGTFPQLPPQFSAKKIDGVRAYDKARKGEAVDLKPVEVTVRELELLSFEPPSPAAEPRTSNLEDRGLLRLRVAATAGFYVRSLAHDIGLALGCGGHLEALRRTRVGRFRITDAATLDQLDATGPGAAGRLLPMNGLLSDYAAVTLTDEGLRRAGNGNPLSPEVFRLAAEAIGAGIELRSGDRVRVLDGAGEVFSVAEWRADGLLHPLLVLR